MSLKEIARVMGYKGANSANGVIKRARKRRRSAGGEG